MAEEPHALLAKALATLTHQQQGQVLKALMGSSDEPLRRQRKATVIRAGMALGKQDQVLSPAALRQAVRGVSGDQASLLVRLPAKVHRELKAWAEANDYSMNTVVTGLVEHFLAGRVADPDAG